MTGKRAIVLTARGGIHDEADLADALRERRIAGAGLDVFLKEPPDLDHPLLHLDNVIVTPHLGGYSVVSLRGMGPAEMHDCAELIDEVVRAATIGSITV